ncbi:MAG: hypothetical protein WAV67_08965, partial [Dokdonella sp.]
LVVGADRGAFYALSSNGFTAWKRLGTDLPNAPVFELTYNAQRDALIAGLFGRGAWRLYGAATSSGQSLDATEVE